MPDPRRTSSAPAASTKIETGLIEIEGRSLPYTLRRSARRRRTLEMRFDSSEGLTVAAPLRTPVSDVERFLLSRRRWILRVVQRSGEPRARSWLTGESLLFRGGVHVLLVQQALVDEAEVRLGRRQIQVAVPARCLVTDVHSVTIEALRQWYMAEAARTLAARLPRWAKALGQRPRRVLVRDQRRRWGSCSRDGTLRFNWRLAMAPPELLDYVVVHELAHLGVADHSPRFWVEVEKALPDHRARRRALRELAPLLDL